MKQILIPSGVQGKGLECVARLMKFPEYNPKQKLIRVEWLPDGIKNDKIPMAEAWFDWNNTGEHEDSIYVYPKHIVGDIVYGRETWKFQGSGYTPGPAHDGKDPKRKQATVQYRSDEGWKTIKNPTDDVNWPVYKKIYATDGWQSSTQMPAWAARYFYEITAVRCLQVREMTEGDVIACGIKAPPMIREPKQVEQLWSDWEKLWNTRHPGSWERNDWVFAYTFKRIEK
jgi:hypothetical protein